MRAKDFLLEYSREKTAGVFGNKIIAALAVDKRLSGTLMPLRNYISQKAKIGAEIPLDQRQNILDIVMAELENADPTPNKEYVQWLTKVYANEKVPLEDVISNGADALKNYHQFKLKKMLEPQFRNIMNLTFLQMAMLAHDPDMVAKLNAANDAKADKGSVDVLLDNDQVRIVIPQNETAAKYYGQGTRWCTAAKNNNMFGRYYQDGDLYILLPKQPKYEGEKYQIHFESGQFMDEEDDQISDLTTLFYKRFGDLTTIFKQRNPELRNYVFFAEDEQLQTLIDRIRQICQEVYINNKEDEWSENDDDWQWQIQDATDDEGNVDWDAVGFNGYRDFNDDCDYYCSKLEECMVSNSHEARSIANAMFNDDEGFVRVDEMEKVFAYSSRAERYEARRRSKNGDIKYTNFADWIEQNIITTATTARLVTSQDKIR